MWSKRLEKDMFKWPSRKQAVIILTEQQLNSLLGGGVLCTAISPHFMPLQAQGERYRESCELLESQNDNIIKCDQLFATSI
ncbi:hypothetical protein CXF81_01360 [Glaciecola sp. 33A]|jgi:transposase|nr:hypothetical protein CXF81_01360 [Glaciecola sp. 33A]